MKLPAPFKCPQNPPTLLDQRGGLRANGKYVLFYEDIYAQQWAMGKAKVKGRDIEVVL